jgi:cupin 2 domain-containing protein
VSTDRGTLRPASAAPAIGETVEVLASGQGWRIEQILSGRLLNPVEDLLDHEEWVVLVAGAATLEVDGATESLREGDWCRLGPGIPHRVISAQPGTSWLAVHLGPGDPDPAR